MWQCLASVRSFLAVWPAVEIIGGIFWVGSVLAAWRSQPRPPTNETVEERELGATVILGQLNGIVTGTSIIIAGLGAFVALSSGDRALVTPHVRYAAIYSALALFVALYTMSTLPTRAPRINFVRDRAVAVLCASALYLVLVAAARFAVGMWVYLER
jgi:hypothetical protein